MCAANNNVGIGARMKMPARTFEVDAARLLHHAVIVRDLQPRTADLTQCRAKILRRDSICGEFLPSAAMDEQGIFKGQFLPCRLQCLVEMLPDHKGKTKDENAFSFMFLEKCTNLIQLQLHRIIQCIDFFSPKHRKTKDSCAACREHCAVLDDGRTVDDEHRQAALPRPIGDNAHEGLLLIRRCLTVEEDS